MDRGAFLIIDDELVSRHAEALGVEAALLRISDVEDIINWAERSKGDNLEILERLLVLLAAPSIRCRM